VCFLRGRIVFMFGSHNKNGSRDSSVGIATGYGLHGRGVGVRVPVRVGYYPLHVAQTGSGAHPASYPIDTGVLSPGVKWPGREADHWTPTSAQVKNLYIYSPVRLHDVVLN
jgi:hypothetical protein